MKRIFITGIYLLLLTCTTTLMGCLKDKDFDKGVIQSVHSTGEVPKVVQLKLAVGNVSNFLLLAVDNSDADTTLDVVPVTLATAQPASEDVHVTISLDSSLVNAYDSANGTDYTPPAPSLFTIVNPEVVIPKGSNTGYVQIKFKPADFIGQDLALGFKIASIKEPGYTVSGNLSTGVVALAVKNTYDGVYSATGYFVHPNPDLTGNYNSEWVAATSGPTSVTFQLNTTALFGAYITLTVNADNSVTVTSDYVALAPYDPAKNYYSPDDKTFHLDFGYSGNTRHLTGTATYEHAR
jgi:Domain of unknown function (DUF1735)/Domain of unknown function (DUF4361)